MAQYKTGSVNVTNGSAAVTGSGTLWSSEVSAGDIFTLVGQGAWYEVASVNSDTSITLSANYAGTTAAGASYAISRDFTANKSIPYPQRGDIETASLLRRAMNIIDEELSLGFDSSNVTITGGTINGTTIGASTASSGAFTTLSASGAVTLSGGTANGVPYLNGSKVLTTGSALTFDGTLLANTGSSSGATLQVLKIANSGSGANTKAQLGFFAAGTQYGLINGGYGGSSPEMNFLLPSGSAGLFTWETSSGSEQMRLTSSLLSVVPGATIEGLTVGRGAGAVSTNTAVGKEALSLNTTGDASVAVGYEALQSNTTGEQQVAVGFRSLLSNTTGTLNTAVGRNALGANTTGGSNTALGTLALTSNTTASNNTAVGYQAGYSSTGNTTQNTAIGSQAAYSNVSGGSWTVAGYRALYSNTTGDYNTAIGDSALYSNTTASNNTAVGYQAGYSNTTGTNNTYVGQGAGYTGTTASNNTAMGNGALYVNTGDNNAAFGMSSLNANTTGIRNAALGQGSLQANTTGNYNTAVGMQALVANTTGSYGTAVGYRALASTVSSNDNTAFGRQALENNTGAVNAAFGSVALGANTTGTYNVAIGTYAGASNTTGSYHAILGYQALNANTTGNYNTAVGYQAAYGNTTGTGNLVVGYQAGLNSTTASYSVFLGRLANGSGTATANYNTGVGNASLYSLSSGASNSALGSGTLFNNTTGSNNVAIGDSTLYSNTTASNNIAVGYQSMYQNTTGAGNTCVGLQTGYALTTGSYNTFIGVNNGVTGASGSAITTGSRNTIIGAYNGNQGGLDIRTANNYIVLSDGDGDPRQWYDQSGYGYLGAFLNGVSNTRKAYVVPGAFNFSGAYLGTATSDGRGASLELLSHSDVSNSGGIRFLCAGDVLGDTQKATLAFAAPTTAYSSLSYTNAISFSPYGIGLGNGTYATSGTGITFPATQSASSNANTLDDYEEGTWTPAVDASGGTGSASYSSQYGSYVKIGQLVYANFYLTFSKNTLSGGVLLITGLPFVANSSVSNQFPEFAVLIDNLATTLTNPLCQVTPGDTNVNIIQGNGSTSAHAALAIDTYIGAGVNIQIRGTAIYRASA